MSTCPEPCNWDAVFGNITCGGDLPFMDNHSAFDVEQSITNQQYTTDGLFIVIRSAAWLITNVDRKINSLGLSLLYAGENRYMKGQETTLHLLDKDTIEKILNLYNSHDQRTRTRLQKEIEAAAIR